MKEVVFVTSVGDVSRIQITSFVRTAHKLQGYCRLIAATAPFLVLLRNCFALVAPEFNLKLRTNWKCPPIRYVSVCTIPRQLTRATTFTAECKGKPIRDTLYYI